MRKHQSSIRFWILVGIVAVSGFSQGMLLPLIAIIFEQDGISSTLNGLNATGLYVGILLVSPFMEQPLRKYGYKPILISGCLLVVISLAAFPLWKSFWFWFILRLFIGIGDHAVHFAAQTWITTFSPANRRGRNIALYGLFFGVGFAIGPLMANLVTYHEALPFIISSAICLIGWGCLFLLKNDFPEQTIEIHSMKETARRFRSAIKYGWIAFLAPLGYGFLEASLNGSFPIYALRIGIDVKYVSMMLVAFALGGIIFQLPLGILSDQYGRRSILMTILFIGFIAFTAASMLEHMTMALIVCLFIAGMAVGSTFSLGISFMADILPRSLLPTGNIICGMAFSIGSLVGPYVGGLFIHLFHNISFFFVISGVLLSLFLVIVTFGRKSVDTQVDTTF